MQFVLKFLYMVCICKFHVTGKHNLLLYGCLQKLDIFCMIMTSTLFYRLGLQKWGYHSSSSPLEVPLHKSFFCKLQSKRVSINCNKEMLLQSHSKR